ncbi:MAG: hypothetical protein MUF18_03770 [Fimbriiglobus sp.]|nr:hypothetical protein [Fimbriiglobus sp.]
MSITFNCGCGERLEVDDELAGLQARCPYCEAVVRVPAAAPMPAKRAKPVRPAATDDERGAYAGSLNPHEGRDRPSKRRRDEDDEEVRPSKRRRDEDDEDEEERPSKRRRALADVDDDDDRPRRRRRAEDEDDEDDDRPRRRRRREPEYKLFNKQTIGGAICIFIGVTVFVVLLFFDIIWFWMLILTVIGFISLIRGLVTGRDQ